MPTEARDPDFVPPSFADPGAGRIVLLADDLTGACDAGAAFLHAGRSVRVWFGTSVQFSTPESVQAFNTNSRALSTRHAARAVTQACTALAGDPNSLFFKKVDSAARGPFAAELLAAHRALGTRADPFRSRFSRRRPHSAATASWRFDDATGKHSRVQLTSLFPIMARGRIFQVSHARELAPALDPIPARPFSSATAPLKPTSNALVRAAKDLPGLLYAGSAGLAQALAGLDSCSSNAKRSCRRRTRTLLIAGSPHPVTKLQLEELRSGSRRQCPRPAPQVPIRRCRAHSLAHSAPTLRRPSSSPAAKPRMLAVQALDAHSFILQGELAPGIPWGIVQGGDGARVHRRHQIRRLRCAHGHSMRFSPRCEVRA